MARLAVTVQLSACLNRGTLNGGVGPIAGRARRDSPAITELCTYGACHAMTFPGTAISRYGNVNPLDVTGNTSKCFEDAIVRVGLRSPVAGEVPIRVRDFHSTCDAARLGPFCGQASTPRIATIVSAKPHAMTFEKNSSLQIAIRPRHRANDCGRFVVA